MTPADKLKEAARQRRIIDAAERRFAPVMAATIAQGMRDMLAQYQATRSAPVLPDAYVSQVRDAFAGLAGAVVPAFSERALEQGKALGAVIERKDGWTEFIARLVADWLAQEVVRRRIVQISETTRQQIVDMIQRGEASGLGVDAIAKSIADQVPSISRWRGALIARTETHGAANYATLEASRASGLDMVREWVSVEDHRTRDFGEGDAVVDEYNHRAMNGQQRGLHEPFDMPHRLGHTIPCMYPGDPTLPGSAVINCRCAVVNIVKSSFF